jgi:hypothetical protein
MRFRVLASPAITAIALFFFAAPMRAQTARASAAVCADGTTSAETGHDVCVGHGGIKTKATSTVHTHITCVDGTVHEDVHGVCDHHGGLRAVSHTTKTTTVAKQRADDRDPKGAIALCKNGMYSHFTTRRGACAEHGGVVKYLVRPGE